MRKSVFNDFCFSISFSPLLVLITREREDFQSVLCILNERLNIGIGILAKNDWAISITQVEMNGIDILLLPFTDIVQLCEGHPVGIDASCE